MLYISPWHLHVRHCQDSSGQQIGNRDTQQKCNLKEQKKQKRQINKHLLAWTMFKAKFSTFTVLLNCICIYIGMETSVCILHLET